jgi:hypothetical protein
MATLRDAPHNGKAGRWSRGRRYAMYSLAMTAAQVRLARTFARDSGAKPSCSSAAPVSKYSR